MLKKISEITAQISPRPVEIETINAAWQTVKTELLISVPLSNRDLQAIATLRNLGSVGREAHRPFPITVARFPEFAQKDMQTEARISLKFKSELSSRFERVFQRDINNMHAALFGNRTVVNIESESKLFTEQESGDLHIEGKEALYLSRVNSLPIEVISGDHFADATPYQRKLFLFAGLIDGAPELGEPNPRQKLREMGLLTPLPLGEVTLLAGGAEGTGTLHCSSEVPKDGSYSTRYSAKGHYNRPQPA